MLTSSSHSKIPILQVFQMLLSMQNENHESAGFQGAGGRGEALRFRGMKTEDMAIW